MITVTIYGLDQFVVGRLSQEMTPSLAKLYEVDEDEINFVAPENMVFHNGVEQTSWNIIIHVNAPMKVSVLQDDVARFILASIGDVAIHKTIEFYYYSQDNRYTKIDDSYPRYITEDNQVNYDDEDLYVMMMTAIAMITMKKMKKKFIQAISLKVSKKRKRINSGNN